MAARKALAATSSTFSAVKPDVNAVAMSMTARETMYANTLVGIFQTLSSGALKNCTIRSVKAAAPAIVARYDQVSGASTPGASMVGSGVCAGI